MQHCSDKSSQVASGIAGGTRRNDTIVSSLRPVISLSYIQLIRALTAQLLKSLLALTKLHFVSGAHDSFSSCLNPCMIYSSVSIKSSKTELQKLTHTRRKKGTNRCLLYRLYSFKNKNIIHGFCVILTLNLRRNY